MQCWQVRILFRYIVLLRTLNRHMLDKDAFAHMKSGVVLINTARGALVDEAALLDALENKCVSFAALDLLETMPPVAHHPLIHHPRVFVTPYNAWYTEESIHRRTENIIASIEGFLRQLA